MIRHLKVLIIVSLIAIPGIAQVELTESAGDCYIPIINQISDLESNKDPKCHATASRLEDFMYGIPLSAEARIQRMENQKTLAEMVWTMASTEAEGENGELHEEFIMNAADEIVVFITVGERWFIQLKNGNKLEIDRTDFRQYSSIAYGLRAILAIQQETLFNPENKLKILSKEAVNRLKFVVDIATLATLKLADFEARSDNSYEISTAHMESAWTQVVGQSAAGAESGSARKIEDYSEMNSNFEMTYRTIHQKLKSYEAYNQIGQSVFMRNIQVYFGRKPWPKDKEESEKLENYFRESLIYFAMDLLVFAEKITKQKNEALISYGSMKQALEAFLPYSINKFEDVIYFPLLRPHQQVVIEAYDLDAFRDSGIHWQYLKFALEDPNFKGSLEPDPFALELLVEGIAQIGVLIWRKTGTKSEELGSASLSSDGMIQGMEEIKELIRLNNSRYGADDVAQTTIQSSTEDDPAVEGRYFTDVTTSTGISFEHRSADWLSRLIRSYVVKEDEQLARLAIPPAFGGGGIAAEDIDHDGWTDILLLSGSGNKLYKNLGDGSFDDITNQSGIHWLREDGHPAEPRQPIISDFDNDGHQDIFISYVNDDHKIYRGLGDGTFEDVSSSSGLGGYGLVGGPCTALDFNRDGLLDIYIGYFGNYLEGELPTLERHNTNGTPNKLFMNKGNFQFEDVSKGSGIENLGWTQAVGHSDINNDGWQDIIVGNDFGINSYYINLGKGKFMDMSASLGTDKPSYTMNVGIADLNRDMYPDFYISNIVVMEKDDKYVSPNKDTRMHFNTASLATMRVVEANDLFISKNSKAEGLRFEESKLVGKGYSSTGWAWDADFFDFDNDGDEDLYCLNGMNDYSVYGTENQYYRSPDGTSEDVTFAESARESNVFFENDGGFLDNRSADSGLDIVHTSRSAAYLDYDNDGDLDVVVNNYHGKAYFFENKSERLNRNWLKVNLDRGDQTDLTADLIGAKIVISTETNKNIWREIHSTTGYLSGHPKTRHFGLGRALSAELTVYWPDDVITKHEVTEINRVVGISRKGKKALIN